MTYNQFMQLDWSKLNSTTVLYYSPHPLKHFIRTFISLNIYYILTNFRLGMNYSRYLPNAGLMMGHRLRRWPSIKPALGDGLMLTGS